MEEQLPPNEYYDFYSPGGWLSPLLVVSASVVTCLQVWFVRSTLGLQGAMSNQSPEQSIA